MSFEASVESFAQFLIIYFLKESWEPFISLYILDISFNIDR